MSQMLHQSKAVNTNGVLKVTADHDFTWFIQAKSWSAKNLKVDRIWEFIHYYLFSLFDSYIYPFVAFLFNIFWGR